VLIGSGALAIHKARRPRIQHIPTSPRSRSRKFRIRRRCSAQLDAPRDLWKVRMSERPLYSWFPHRVRLAESDVSVSTARTMRAFATRDTPPQHESPSCAVRKLVVRKRPDRSAFIKWWRRTGASLLFQYTSAERDGRIIGRKVCGATNRAGKWCVVDDFFDDGAQHWMLCNISEYIEINFCGGRGKHHRTGSGLASDDHCWNTSRTCIR